MDRLDEQGRHGWHLIFDNAPIHTPKFIHDKIEQRGYHMVLLPRYSPFLNPIEEFFSKVLYIWDQSTFVLIYSIKTGKAVVSKRC